MATLQSIPVEMKESQVVEAHPRDDDLEIGEVKALDAAEDFLHDNNISHARVHELLSDEPRSRKLVRKIDRTILPLLAGTYMLQFIDKQALSYGAVFDLFTGTHVTGHQYALLATWFYLGYLIAEYPWSYAAQKWSVGKVVAGTVTAWGALLMISAACSSYPGLSACRFFLGCLEAPITPCFMMIVGMWYTRDEQPFRAGIFYCCNGFGSMCGGILTYAIGQEHTFPVWKTIFILCGGVTVLWGILLMYFMPGDIISAKRFTQEEKAILIGRNQVSQTGILNRNIKWYQIRECFVDPQVWILFVFTFLNELINGGLSNFQKLILKSVVTGALETTALAIPQGAFQVFYILTGTYIASKLKNCRTIIMAIYICPTLIGTALLWKLPRTNKYGSLMAFYIVGGFVASLVLALQMPATNLGGYTKRVTATAFVFLAYCLGNMIGPQAFLAKEAPLYPTGCKLIIGCTAGQITLACLLRALLIRRNKKRDALVLPPTPKGEDEVIIDLTDFENPHFRYVY